MRVEPDGGVQLNGHVGVYPSKPSIRDLDVLLAVAAAPAQWAEACVALLLLGVSEAGAPLLAKVGCSRADGVLGGAGGPSATVLALAGERSPVVKAESALARFGVTDSLMALLHISPSPGKWNNGHLVSSLHHQVKDATSEASVDGQIVRKTSEVVDLVAADEELAIDVEVGKVARGQTSDVGEVVHLHPAPSASPASVKVRFFVQLHIFVRIYTTLENITIKSKL